jgi:hypothetical protein
MIIYDLIICPATCSGKACGRRQKENAHELENILFVGIPGRKFPFGYFTK